jgi:Raf kinase inhibitor-like YbhB/YbcL family protein
MNLTSPAFENGAEIPTKHTCEGDDVSPALEWSDLPDGTRTLALLCDDPDAPGGTFTHWLAWGIDPGANTLGEAEKPPAEGRNDFGRTGYGGPCPPHGHGPHRYFFRLYALAEEPALQSGAEKPEVENAVASALAVAELMGTFERG